MKTLLKVVPALLLAGTLLLNPVKQENPKPTNVDQQINYMKRDPGTGVG
ncbi:hypothetical protein V7183_15010 [Bacillus sp. JJ1127]